MPLPDGAFFTTETGVAQAVPDDASQYTALMRHRLLRLAGAMLVMLALTVTDILTGPAMLSLSDVLTGLFSPGQAAAPTISDKNASDAGSPCRMLFSPPSS